MTNFGENLRMQRKTANLTQAQLAKELGVTDSSIFDWEKGRTEPKFIMLVKIAEYFGITVDKLLRD